MLKLVFIVVKCVRHCCTQIGLIVSSLFCNFNTKILDESFANCSGKWSRKKLLFFWILSIMGRNILSVTSPFNTPVPPPSSRRQSYASDFLINIAQNNLPQTIYELSPNYVIINNVAFDTIAP